MTFFRKMIRPRASDSSAERARAADQLRADMSALERDVAESIRVLADIGAGADAAEARAMEAIRAGDDRAARAALVEHRACVDKAAAIEADLKVLQSILDECYQFAKELSDSPPSQPSN